MSICGAAERKIHPNKVAKNAANNTMPLGVQHLTNSNGQWNSKQIVTVVIVTSSNSLALFRAN